jgi:hypothetical protein
MTARIGRKMPAAEPLPDSVWRYWLKRLVYLMLAALLVSLNVAVMLAFMRA